MGKRKAVPGATVTARNITEHDGHKFKELEGVEIVQVTPLGRDICVVSHSVWQGKRGLDIRRYYLSAEEELWCPTGKGIRIPEESAQSFLEQIKTLEGFTS